MNRRLSRQSFLGDNSDQLLQGLHVALVGLGGGGSHIGQQLAHIGVGTISLFDHDKVDESNLNRLVGATASDVERGEWKSNIAARMIRSINPKAHVLNQPARWQERAELLRSCDVIFGCVDTFIGRSELERTARRFLTPYIDIGMDVHKVGAGYSITGQVAISMPGEVCLLCMNVLSAERIAEEAANYGEAGGRPQVIWPNGVLASTAVGMMVALVTPWFRGPIPSLLEYDGNSSEIRAAASLDFLRKKSCPHYMTSEDLGDPWFQLPPDLDFALS